MDRKAMEILVRWKERQGRKPLIVEGARQVGKTWLMREFGRQYFKKVFYLNFDGNSQAQELFAESIFPKDLLPGLELLFGEKIVPDETLLIFDEVQEVPRALASLKYFCEEAPEYYIVCAGSLLGIALHPGTSFPVGKVEFLKLYPLSYEEFLRATGRERFADLLNRGEVRLITSFREQYIAALREYYFVGGMPEAVAVFGENRDFWQVREVQKRILAAYEQDFSKHAPAEVVPRIRLVWNSVLGQLAKENRKFVYGMVREGARAREYELAIMWLCDCGLVHKVVRVNSGYAPLKMYEDMKAFKLYLVDVGLLCCMAGVAPQILVQKTGIFKEFKGALTEQYVLQELSATYVGNVCYYTNDRSSCEVDFVLDGGGQVIPLEVKAEINLQAKSLKVFAEKFQVPLAVRCSVADWEKQEGLLNLPLYMVGRLN